jgi:hypothetical protein
MEIEDLEARLVSPALKANRGPLAQMEEQVRVENLDRRAFRALRDHRVHLDPYALPDTSRGQ